MHYIKWISKHMRTQLLQLMWHGQVMYSTVIGTRCTNQQRDITCEFIMFMINGNLNELTNFVWERCLSKVTTIMKQVQHGWHTGGSTTQRLSPEQAVDPQNTHEWKFQVNDAEQCIISVYPETTTTKNNKTNSKISVSRQTLPEML
jgi:DNA-binding NtrC family response regulator